MKELSLGMTATYIQDYPFNHLTEIPAEAAVAWVQQMCPEANMGLHLRAKELTVDGNNDTDARCNGWLNKLFIIVGASHGQWLALVKWDDHFSLYIQRTPDKA